MSYQTGPDKEQTKTAETVGSSPMQSFANDDKCKENNGTRERSQQGWGSRFDRRLGRKKALDGKTRSARGLWSKLVASPSPTGNDKGTEKLMPCDRLDDNRTLEEETTAHRFPPGGAKEASSASSKY
jgi:hypothetical protein